MQKALAVTALLGVALVSCTQTAQDEVAIRVVVEAKAPMDCIRIVASDEHKGPPSRVEFPAPVSPGTERTFVVAVYRHPDWGKRARIIAEGLKGGCDGTVVSAAVPQVSPFEGRDRLQTVTLVLGGTDADQDGYVGALPSGALFDCDETNAQIHPEAAERCDELSDKNCDQRVGCQRIECLGQKDGMGLRCCPTGASSGIEASCSDRLDDDCDGLADCADPDCTGKVCDAYGRTCSPAGTCVCQSAASVESVCGNSQDDDCDGLLDCEDPDCNEKSCSAGKCIGGGCCTLGADGGVSTGVEHCADGIDNDCNMATDCADLSCAGKPSTPGKVCCGATGAAVNAVETDCSNGQDDDCDGLADCADLDCNAKTCSVQSGQFGVCTAFVCRAETCNNVVDDNGDGLADCADPLCAGKACNAAGTKACSKNACVCPGGAGFEGSGAAHCSDGQDNDCDGDVDCADSSCALLTCANGKICQAGACTCSLAEANEISCSDGADNDCDGQVDCADPDCSGRACSAAGGVCSGSSCTCELGAESVCLNGADDDCDGLADCADSDCAGKSCGGFGKVCAANACACPGGGVESCQNGVDDDCDGLVDCVDVAGCPQNAACSPGGRQCTSSLCTCRAGQSPEVACNDGVDNDCDGLKDCADADCAAKSCGPFGQLCAGAPPVCACPSTTENCANGVDDDCDGLVDCADPGSCPANTACGANGKTCSQNGVCLCPWGQSAEASCADGADNDCDGVPDCKDADCQGVSCSTTGQAFCCGSSCTATASQGNCGYCSATCASPQTCSAHPGSSIMDCTCATDADCLPSNRCHTFLNGEQFCVECESNADCPAGRPVCSPSALVCYCPPDTVCTPQCTSDSDCSGGTPKCSVGLSRCVGCLSGADCPSGQTCRNLACTP